MAAIGSGLSHSPAHHTTTAARPAHHASHLSVDARAPAGVNALRWSLSSRAERQEIIQSLEGSHLGPTEHVDHDLTHAAPPRATLAEMAKLVPWAGPLLSVARTETATEKRKAKFSAEPRVDLTPLADPRNQPRATRTMTAQQARSAQIARLFAVVDHFGPAEVLVDHTLLTLRTAVSPKDGVTSINTGLILSAIAKLYRGAEPNEKAALKTLLRNQLTLLTTPASKQKDRGSPESGLQLPGDAVAGPTNGGDAPIETVNQTAVVVLGLNRLLKWAPHLAKENLIDDLTAKITTEFQNELKQSYPDEKPTPGHESWHYGPNTKRPEDPAHVYFTFQQLLELDRLINPDHAKDKNKPRVDDFYAIQFMRIRNTLKEVFAAKDPNKLPNRTPLGEWLAQHPLHRPHK
jgi:hypothetical protein